MKENSKLCVTEGIAGYYHYHLSFKDSTTRSLCGKHTMITEVPQSAWGTVTHLREKYCKECQRIAKNI